MCSSDPPDGRLLAVLQGPRHIRLLDAATYSELASLPLDSRQFVHSLVFSRCSTRLIAGTTAPGYVIIWNLHEVRDELRSVALDWSHAAWEQDENEPADVNVKIDLPELTRRVMNSSRTGIRVEGDGIFQVHVAEGRG